MTFPNPEFLESPTAFREFLSAWENCKLPGSAFTHAAHIAVGGAYSARFGEDALNKLRNGIMRFNVSAGGVNGPDSGYHETITRFWAVVIAHHIAEETDEFRAAQSVVQVYGDRRDLTAEFYSFDVVKSREARAAWVEPDLKPLP